MRKKNTYFRGSLRDLLSSKGRLIAIVLIVALGAGFFGGIKVTSLDMKLTADQYYKQANLMDFRVVSTLGITDRDVAAIRDIPGVREAMPSYRLDAIVTRESDSEEIESDSVIRIHALEDGNNTINRVKLVEGRLPEKDNEIVLLSGNKLSSAYRIGDTVSIDLEADPDVADDLRYTELQVVGMVDTPQYMSIEKASTSKGSGTVNNYGYVPAGTFQVEAYTELYLTVDGADGVSCFSGDYDGIIDEISEKLEDIGVERCEIRRAEVVDEATDKLNDAKEEYNEKKAEADEKLADAQAKLDDAYRQLDDGERELADARKKLSDGEKELEEKQAEFDDKVLGGEQTLIDAFQEISDGENDLIKAKNELAKKKQELEDGRKSMSNASTRLSQMESQYSEGKAALEQGKAQLNGAIAQAQQVLEDSSATEEEKAAAQGTIAYAQGALQALAPKEAELASARAQLDDGHRQLASAADEIRSGQLAINDAEDQLAEAEETLVKNRKEAEEKWIELQDKKVDAQQQLADARQEIADGKVDLADGEKELADAKVELADAQKEYDEKKAEADEKLTDAERQIADAEQEIADIETPDWYVLSRDDDTVYAGFEQDADRINAISLVFPVFFFLVAALVCLTTMTRMIEEERTQIGVLKALGFGKGAILGKYLFFAGATTIVGALIGLTIGFQVFPRVIWAAYGIMYNTPSIQTPFNVKYALLATIVFLICTIGSTFAACWTELMSSPANLIRPKPPKNGKRVFLENIPFLWKRLSFTKKLTARNILRYKKRFFMTVIGIAGCTALMLTGFGLKDSINGIVSNQFENLWHYDMQLSFVHEIRADEPTLRQEEALAAIGDDERIQKSLLVHQETTTAHSAKTDQTVSTVLFVPQDTDTVTDFITFHERRGKTPVAFPKEGGAVLTEKLAKELGLGMGDTVTLEDVDNRRYDFTVAGIIENYVYHYAYVSPAEYERVTGKECTYQGMLAMTDGSGAAFENKLSNDLLAQEEIAGISFTSAITDNFTKIFDRLDLVVLVLIVSASLLAFVVLYNLTNININERLREIATIKVLGFYDREVDSYIYRENAILTLIGILAGCVLGIFLHQYVMRIAEVNIVMFGRDILPLSYLWAALLTAAFAGIVNFVMHFRLKRVSMVESLKSIE